MTNAEIEDLLFVLAQFINQSGVIATGDLLVEAQTTPDMTVKVAVGRAVLKTSDGRNGYPVYNDASANVTIAANSTGVTKIDAVVLYWDGAAVSDANATNVAKLTTVRGSGSVAPTDAEIQTAVGAGNPFLRLAEVTVANGAVSINSGNIADKRVYADPAVRRVDAIANGILTASKVSLGQLLRLLDNTQNYKVQWGAKNVVLTGQITNSAAVTFSTPFATGLSLLLVSVGGTTTNPVSKYVAASFSGTTAGFSIEVSYWPNVNTTDTVTVSWIAIGY